MTELVLSIVEPFTSPAWGSNFAVFSSPDTIPEEDTKDYLRRVCKYAQAFGVYLVPQRFWLLEHRCLCLISPAGRVLGAQQGIYRNTRDRQGKQGREIQVLNTEFGGILLCVDVDIYRPEVTRFAEGMGAQYIVCSQFIADADYNSSAVITGPWNAAQTGGVYVIDACNQFHCVCAPLELSHYRDGFLISPTRRTPTTARIQGDALRELRRPFRLGRKFYAVHRSDLLR